MDSASERDNRFYFEKAGMGCGPAMSNLVLQAACDTMTLGYRSRRKSHLDDLSSRPSLRSRPFHSAWGRTWSQRHTPGLVLPYQSQSVAYATFRAPFPNQCSAAALLNADTYTLPLSAGLGLVKRPDRKDRFPCFFTYRDASS